MNLYDMTPAQAWDAWKGQRLTFGEMANWQTIHNYYFNEKGEKINETRNNQYL